MGEAHEDNLKTLEVSITFRVVDGRPKVCIDCYFSLGTDNAVAYFRGLK